MSKSSPHSAEFKAKVALAALREQETLSELSSQYGIHSNQVSAWKKQLQEGAHVVFDHEGLQRQVKEHEALVRGLYEQIGQLQYTERGAQGKPVEKKRYYPIALICAGHWSRRRMSV